MVPCGHHLGRPTPNREGYVRCNYFWKSDTYMSRDHVGWEASHTCTSTKYGGLDLTGTQK